MNTEGDIYAWTSIAQNIKKRLDNIDDYNLSQFVSLFNSLETVYGSDCKQLISERNSALSELTDKIILLLNDNNKAKSDLIEFLELASEHIQDNSVEESDNNDSNNSDTDFLRLHIQKWLKAYCYHKVSNSKDLSDEQNLIAEILLPVINNHFDSDIQKIGEMMVFEQYAQYTRGIRVVLLNTIPARYKKFRSFLSKSKYKGCNLGLLKDIMQRSQGRELHFQEQSLLLAFINSLVKIIKMSNIPNVRHPYIDAYEEVARPIIGIDEVTDFSTCEINAMQSLLNLDFNSFTLCGDIMQRISSHGIESWKELDEVLSNYYPFEMKTSYRQSKKLLALAKQLCSDSQEDVPNFRSFMKSNRVPAPLAYINDNEILKTEWISNRISEVYRAYGEQLPSIAIFVTDKGYIKNFIERMEETLFFKDNNIMVLDGTGSVQTTEKHICVYPIDVVKGMEFDVVFFHNIDKTDADISLVKRYIYVGVSRAAFFLGITMNEDNKDISRYFEKDKDWFHI